MIGFIAWGQSHRPTDPRASGSVALTIARMPFVRVTASHSRTTEYYRPILGLLLINKFGHGPVSQAEIKVSLILW